MAPSRRAPASICTAFRSAPLGTPVRFSTYGASIGFTASWSASTPLTWRATYSLS